MKQPSFKSKSKRRSTDNNEDQSKRSRRADGLDTVTEQLTQALYKLGYDIKPRYENDATFGFVDNFATTVDIKEVSRKVAFEAHAA